MVYCCGYEGVNVSIRSPKYSSSFYDILTVTKLVTKKRYVMGKSVLRYNM